MCCPWFEPVAPLEGGARTSMLPLGGLWAGVCRAAEGQPWNADDAALRMVCNLGYPQCRCGRFRDGGADAVRFTMGADRGDFVTLRYAVERDHHPLAHGAFDLPAREDAPQPSELLQLQARAYLHSYLRRTRTDF